MQLFSPAEIELIHQNAAEAERDKRLSVNVLDILYRHKLLKLFVPIELGGREETLPAAVKIFDECAFVDGTLGWLAAIGSGGNYFAGYYSADVAKRLFLPHTSVLAGSGYPGKARKTNGGYIVSGSWRYCSGAGFATFFTATAVDEEGTTKAFTFMPAQVEIINDWSAFGLKATESNSIIVREAFVPHGLVFDLAKPPLSFHQYPVYSFPFLLFAQYSFAAVVLGLCKAFIKEAHACIINRPAVAATINRETAILEQLSQTYYASALENWEAHKNGSLTETMLAAGANAAWDIAEKSTAIANAVFPHLGMAALIEGNAINRIYRNLLTANQHMLLRRG